MDAPSRVDPKLRGLKTRFAALDEGNDRFPVEFRAAQQEPADLLGGGSGNQHLAIERQTSIFVADMNWVVS